MMDQKALSQSLVAKGLGKHQLGEMSEALRCYTQALKKDSQNADAANLAGLVHQQAGDNQSAVQFFQAALAVFPDEPMYIVNAAATHYEIGNKQLSADIMSKLSPDRCKDPHISFNAGNVYKQMENLVGALAFYKNALNPLGEVPKAPAVYIECLFDLGMTEQGLAFLTVLENAGQLGEEESLLKARALYKLERRAEAIVVFDQLVGAILERDDYHLWKGGVLVEYSAESPAGDPRNYWKEGLDHLLKSISLNPLSPAPHMALAINFWNLRNYSLAEQFFSSAFVLTPDNPGMLLKYGHFLIARNKYEKAELILLEVAEIDASLAPEANLFLATGYYKQAYYYNNNYQYQIADKIIHKLEDIKTWFEKENLRAHVGYCNSMLTFLSGAWEQTLEALTGLDRLNGHETVYWELMIYSQLYLGLLEDAKDSIYNLREKTPRHNFIEDILPFVHRWLGHFDALIRYVDDLDKSSSPQDWENNFTPYNEAVTSLPLAVLADYDFTFKLRFSVSRLAGEGALNCVFRLCGHYMDSVNEEGRFSLRADVDCEGNLLISFTNGHQREFAVDHQKVGKLANEGEPLTILLQRRNGALTIKIEDEEPFEFAECGDNDFIGDTLNFPRVKGSGGAILGVDLAIEKYKIKQIPAENGTARKKVFIYTSFFGATFAHMLTASMMPSLMRASNLPAVLEACDVQWFLYTTPIDNMLTGAFKEQVKELGVDVHVDTHIMEKSPRADLFRTLVDVIERAEEEGAIVLMSPPDHIFGDGLADVLVNMDQYDYVVCGHPRIELEACRESLWKHIANGNGVSPLDNRQLVTWAVEKHPHCVVKTGMNTNEPWWNCTPSDDGYEVRFKEPPPLAFYATKDLISVILGNGYVPLFGAIDHDIVDFMHRTGRLKWFDDNEDFFWIEYCKKTRNVPTIRNTFWSPAAQMFAKRSLKWTKAKDEEGNS